MNATRKSTLPVVPAALALLLIFLGGWTPGVEEGSTGQVLRPAQAAQLQTTTPPSVAAQTVELSDGLTGRVLYAHHANEKRPIASITKLMTALLAIRRLKMNQIVDVSERAASTPGSSMYLVTGDRVPVLSLLFGMLVQSGNDAAEAVAEAIAGNDTRFAAMMNREATRDGLTCSHFVTPNGLDAANEYSCASDVTRLSRLVLADHTLAAIVATRATTVPGASGARQYPLLSTNQLLGTYPGAIGVKTGTTTGAGASLSGAARRQGHTLIAVVLGSTEAQRFPDDEAVLTFGFGNYTWPRTVDTMWSTQSLRLRGTLQTAPVPRWELAWIRVNRKGRLVVPATTLH